MPGRWNEHVLCTKVSLANVRRTQHLRYQRGKQCKAKERGTTTHVIQSDASYVEGTVSRPHVTNPYEENVYQSPDAQASKAEQFAQTFSPLAQIKTIGPKAA